MTKKKEDELEKVRKEIDQIAAQEQASGDVVFKMQTSHENINTQFDDAKLRLEEMMMEKAQLEHMMQRMKKDHIALKIKSGEMEQSLKNKQNIMGLELKKQRESKE